MRKVCILTSVHPPFDTRIFHKEAITLVQAGYNVVLIVQHDKNELVDGVKIIALPKPKSRFWRMLGTWKVFKLALRQKAHMYHFHDPELLPVGILLKIFTKSKIIYDVHEDYPEAILTKSWLLPALRKPISYFFNLFEKSICQQLSYTIVATEAILQKFNKEKSEIIANYPIIPSIKPKQNYDFTCPVLLYVGGLEKMRGISEIVKAMQYIDSSSHAKLQLIGKFSSTDYEEEIAEISEANIVEYLGWMKPNLVWQNITQATIGVVCSHPIARYIVAIPTKLFEYMAAGLPVISSNFPLLKEIVEGNKCGLIVNPLEPKEIAAAAEYLIDHPEEAKQMGENGRKAVMEKYNWETESKKLISIYNKLLANQAE